MGSEGDGDCVDLLFSIDDQIGRCADRCPLEARELQRGEHRGRTYRLPCGGHLPFGGDVDRSRRRRVQDRLEVDAVEASPTLDRGPPDGALSDIRLGDPQRPGQKLE